MIEERDLLLNEEAPSANVEIEEISGEATLESLGNLLRRERERQELSLSYVAGETKIRQVYLEGIESGELDGFHGNVYRRGFVRSYLSLLGRDDLWHYYDGLLSENSEIIPESTPPLGDFTPPAKGFRKGSRKGIVAFLLIVIAVSTWYVWNNRDNIRDEVAKIQQEQLEHAQEAEKKAQQSIKEEVPKKVENPKVVVSQDLPAVEVIESEYPVLLIKATKDSWIRVTREKERLFGGTLKAGSQKAIEGSGRIYAIYGSPENLKVSWNGKKLDIAPLNGTGPVHFLYAPDGSHKSLTSKEAEAIWDKTEEKTPVKEEKIKEEVKKGPSVIVFKAVKGDCWIQASLGGKKLYVGTLKKGSEKSLELTGSISAKFGNPSAVTVFIDGKDVGRPGKAGQIGRMIYNEDGTFHQVKKK